MFHAGTATPCPSQGSCPSFPVAHDTPGPAPCPDLEGSPSGPPPVPAPDAGPGPSTPAPPTHFAQPVLIYQQRAQPAPLPLLPPVAPSSSGSPMPSAASSPPATPTPPPRPTAARVATPVYHPPLLHRHSRHVHPTVMRHVAGTLQPQALATMPGDSQVSPYPLPSTRPCWTLTGVTIWKRSTLVYCGNVSVVYLSTNPVQH